MSIQALPFVIVLGSFYGTTLIASRFSIGQYAPTTYLGLRLVMASLLHIAVYLLVRKRHWPVDRNLWRYAVPLGVFGTAIPMTSIITSLQYQSSGITSLLLTTNPALTVLMAHFFLSDEHLSRRKALGVTLALSGAAMLLLLGESGLPDVTDANPLGYILVLTAMVLSSGASVYMRRFMSAMDVFDVASIRMWVAAAVVMPLSFFMAGFDLSAVTPVGYGVLVYAALIGTFAALMLTVYNIKRFGATAAAITAYVTPVVATISGVIVLGETVTPGMIVGMVTIIGGIAILNERRERATRSGVRESIDRVLHARR
jgi:drug/metabolite transporter (DMT)-like permease